MAKVNDFVIPTNESIWMVEWRESATEPWGVFTVNWNTKHQTLDAKVVSLTLVGNLNHPSESPKWEARLVEYKRCPS